MKHTYGQLERTLEGFLESHLQDLENEERVEALAWYCQGLGLELPNKTVLGIATRLNPDNVEHCRQRMQRALQLGRFAHGAVFQRIQATVFETAPDLIAAYALDDTGIAKKGKSSVGVQRQYSGTLGKVDNCQVVVSLHGVSNDFGVCLGAELFLPESWIDDDERLDKSRVPEDHRCVWKKPEIALRLLKAAVENGAPRRPVVADAGYGDSRDFRDGIAELGLPYSVGVSSNTCVWPVGAAPATPKPTGQVGRPPSYERDPGGKEPIRVDRYAEKLWRSGKFKSVTWRRGTKGPLRGKFCAVRLRSAERRTRDRKASEPLWLLIERDPSRASGFKFHLSNLPEGISLKKLVSVTKVRWHIERDYQDMKQNLGFDRYEGRTWGGFHRHLAMVALMHAFLSLHREAFSPDLSCKSVDMGGLSPCRTCGAHALGGPLPHLQEAV